MNLKPLFDNVVVEHVEQDDKTTRRHFSSRYRQREAPRGHHPGGRRRPRDRQRHRARDDTSRSAIASLYRKYSGSEVKIDGTEYLIIPEKDILAIVDKVPAGV